VYGRTGIIFSTFLKGVSATSPSQQQTGIDHVAANINKKKVALPLEGILLLALLVPLTNFLPNRMPEQNSEQNNQTAYQLLS
jgi:hypothetical protein